MLELELQEINENLEKNKIDFSLTDSVMDKGLQAAGFHPVTIIQQEIEDIFISMGFEVLDGLILKMSTTTLRPQYTRYASCT